MIDTASQADKGRGIGKIIPKHPHISWLSSALVGA